MKSWSVTRKAATYAGWIALCAALFGVLGDAEDPSRRRDRIGNEEAAVRAAAVLHREKRFAAYEVVHVAYAKAGEGGREARWVVLLDREPRTGLDAACVVELKAKDGAVIAIRAPK